MVSATAVVLSYRVLRIVCVCACVRACVRACVLVERRDFVENKVFERGGV